MKTILLSLGIFCTCLSACTKDHPAPNKPGDTATVGKGVGGQSVGTSFGGSVGAGNSETRGSNVGQEAPGTH